MDENLRGGLPDPEGLPLTWRSMLGGARVGAPTHALLATDGPGALFAAQDQGPTFLRPEDLGAGFVELTRSHQRREGRDFRVVVVVRGGLASFTLEPSGLLYAQAMVFSATNELEAVAAYGELQPRWFEGVTEMAAPRIGNASRAGVALGEGPFDGAAQVVSFHARRSVALLAAVTYEAPLDLERTLAVAKAVEARL